MNPASVSVIIPTYNRAHTIEQAIRSALAQTVKDLEIIVADDGSKDDTERVIRELNEPRVRYIRKANGGCSSARNFGAASSTREYLAFLDSDDAWHPEWIARATAIMDAEPTIGAVYGSLQLESADGTPKGVMDLTLNGRHPEATVPYVLSQCMGLLGSNVIARREIVHRIGGWDETFPTAGDLDFGLRLATETRVALIGEPMIHLRETAGSLSKNVNTGNRLRVLDRFEARCPELARQHADIIRRSRARILRSYGLDLLSFGRVREAEQQLRASLRTAPSLDVVWLLMKAQILKIVRPEGVGTAG